jgi:hypothetical protein
MKEVDQHSGISDNLVRTHQYEITEFLHLHTCLEGQLQLATLYDNIWEIEQMDLKRICKGKCSKLIKR